MGPTPSGRSPEIVVKRRLKRHRRRSRIPGLVAVAAAGLLILLGGWKLVHLARRRPRLNPQANAEERRELVASVNKSVNKAMAQSGKNMPAADLVVGTATLHQRDGKTYLTGAVQNRSPRDYPRVHIVFYTFDGAANPTGLVETDVIGVPALKEASFEMGPVSPQARTFAVESIHPVE